MSPPSTLTAVVKTRIEDPRAAGEAMGKDALAQLGGQTPDALIVFVSPRYDAKQLVRALRETCRPSVMVGCSSAGEFTNHEAGEGLACALAIRSSDVRFAAGMGRKISESREAAAKAMVASFRGTGQMRGYSAALVLTDALAGHADELIEQLTVLTGAGHQFFGGGAGDDASFRYTQVFCGEEVQSDAAVALEILSPKPIGVGVRHGWYPASAPMRATEVHGMTLVSLNAAPTVEAFREHAEQTNQTFDTANPTPFFLHNILGIDTGQGFKLRVPLGLQANGAVLCAAEIPEGATVRIMTTDPAATQEAAAQATQAAVDQLEGHTPKVAIFFDCVATRLRMGRKFGDELAAIQHVLGDTPFVGCNTYGQVARVDGQFSGFHNCTAVVCVLPA
jgi:hypothetical protein